MKEKTLLKIAIIISLIGIAMLYFATLNIGVDETSLDKITKNNIGEIVKIKGTLSKITNTEKVVFLEITQPSQLTIILFKDKNLTLSEGQNLEIIGKIDEYNGKIEVIAERVRIIN